MKKLRKSGQKETRVRMVSSGGCRVVPTTIRKKPVVGGRKGEGDKELE
jgi:hypothetical protein